MYYRQQKLLLVCYKTKSLLSTRAKEAQVIIIGMREMSEL